MPKIVTFSYSGKPVGVGVGSPSVRDIAVSLWRICRWAGNGSCWFSVAAHSLVVAALLPDHLKVHGLLHDSSELFTNDIVSVYKDNYIRKQEEALLGEISKGLGLDLPSKADHKAIKRADTFALRGEIFTVGESGLQREFRRYPEAERLVLYFTNKFAVEDCVNPNGKAVEYFVKKFDEFKLLAEKKAA